MAKTISLRNFDFISLTDKGKERKKNEDYLAYFDTFNGHVFVVCDGMGGHKGGAVASEIAVEAIGDFFNSNYHTNPFEAIENAINFANKKVLVHAKQKPELFGMGTTIVLVLIRDDRVYYGHAGDSRLYSFSQNKLKQLTSDHSYVNQLVQDNIISEKEAKSHPRKNEITRALGLTEKIVADVTNSAFLPDENDIILLCSDGLNSMVDDKQIQNSLSSNVIIEKKASELISKAIRNGGIDNISVQLIRFHNINHDYKPKALTNWNKDKIYRYIFSKWTYIIAMLAVPFFIFLFWGSNKSNNVSSESHELIISKGHKTTNDGMLIIYPYQIKSGDKFELIAEIFNVKTDYLKSLNPNLDVLIEGMHLKIPIQDTYFVSGGDELQLICLQYGINPIDLMKVNGFYTSKLTIGQELIIPLANDK